MLESILKNNPKTQKPFLGRDQSTADKPVVPAPVIKPAVTEVSRVYMTACSPACPTCSCYLSVERTFSDGSRVEKCFSCGVVIEQADLF